MRFIWFMIKYTFLLVGFITTFIAGNYGWWNEDSRRSFLLILGAGVSYGPILITYLEHGDWLSFKR